VSPATRTAVVTGASTGIGRACAERLDSLGWRVFAGVRSDTAAEELRSAGSERLTPVRIDVTDAESIAAAAEVTEAMGTGGLDGLVNNAGIAVAAPMEFVPIDELRRQIEVNLIGQVAVTQAFLPLLRPSRGRIVNVSSIGGLVASAFFGPYNASKYGLEAVSDALRQELRPWGIKVCVVEPGAMATPIWDKGVATADELIAGASPAQLSLYEKQIQAMRRAAQEASKRGSPPQKVAQVIEKALTVRRPKARYLVGGDARGQFLASRILPTRVFDRMVTRVLGVK
jgi:NAD(P)-dependent dehydrogenase (short-subunit alcohol dehydrogenase family)